MSQILFADPAGNLTAIIRGAEPEKRLPIAKAILDAGKAEQVGFEVPPMYGGCGRLEMMGGEFCGNAARAFAFQKAAEQWPDGEHELCVEISGVEKPVPVRVDLDNGTAFAQMPLPLELACCEVDGTAYPVVVMEGIWHLIAEDREPSEEFVKHAIQAVEQFQPEAFGILFLQQERLTPAVWVRATQSLVWESSCGSGSLACGWYLSKRETKRTDGEARYTFSQRGGVIETVFCRENDRIVSCSMGGSVLLSGWEPV